MNIPLGEPYKRGKVLKFEDIMKDVKEFMEAKKIGYLALTLHGDFGFEEGFLAFDSGIIIASSFQYLKYNKIVNAGAGLKRVLNSFRAKKGVYDIYTWTTQQLELFKVFNEDMLLLEGVTPVKLLAVMPKAFDPSLEEGDLKQFLEKKETREDIMKQYGITDVKEEKPIEEVIAGEIERGMIEDHRRLEEALEEYVKGPASESPKGKESGSKAEGKGKEEPVIPNPSAEVPVGHGVEKFKKLSLKEEKK